MAALPERVYGVEVHPTALSECAHLSAVASNRRTPQVYDRSAAMGIAARASHGEQENGRHKKCPDQNGIQITMAATMRSALHWRVCARRSPTELTRTRSRP